MSLHDPLPDGLRPGGRFDRWRRLPCTYVVTDVDGTLIGPLHHATDDVVDAVRALADAGVVAGFATGREWDTVVALQEQLGMPGPHVLHNGGEVRADDAVLARWSLPPAEIDQLLRICADLDLYAEVYVGDGFLVTDRRDYARLHWDLLGKGPDGLIDGRCGAQLPPAVKATVVLAEDGPDVATVIARLDALGASVSVGWAPPTPQLTYVNITHPDADKGKALAVAADHIGVPLTAVGAVGDGLNDVPLLEVAGTAIAMGQAPAQVHAAAHLIVPEVAEDGVAHALAALAAWARA